MAKDNSLTEKYAAACQQTAEQAGVEYIDLYMCMMAEQVGSDLFLCASLRDRGEQF